ncbi:MAG: hypothetical protein JXA01_02415 [Dehalococcoidia bacterium]|nr:hypothetical protein [Dehalococcoidia bacterium]
MKLRIKVINVFVSTLVILTAILTGCTSSQGQTIDSGSLVFQDDFTDPSSGWFIYNADDAKSGGYQDGAYSIGSIGKNTVIVLNPKTRQQLANFSAEVDLRSTSKQPGAFMGIIYRLNNSGIYYRFAISDNQTYYVGKRTELVELEIMPKTHSESIKPVNEYNHLKVVCSGDSHEFYANGAKLGSLTDNTSLSGELGVAFSNWSPSENFTFTNFKLYNLK